MIETNINPAGWIVEKKKPLVGIDRESIWCCSFSASLCVLGVSAFGFSTQRPRRPRSFAESVKSERGTLASRHGEQGLIWPEVFLGSVSRSRHEIAAPNRRLRLELVPWSLDFL